jgi:hypothetical protein
MGYEHGMVWCGVWVALSIEKAAAAASQHMLVTRHNVEGASRMALKVTKKKVKIREIVSVEVRSVARAVSPCWSEPKCV